MKQPYPAQPCPTHALWSRGSKEDARRGWRAGVEWLAAGIQGPLTKARAVGQLRPGMQLEATPKCAQ